MASIADGLLKYGSMLDAAFESSGDNNLADYFSTFAANLANQLAPGQNQTIGLLNLIAHFLVNHCAS